MPRPLPPKPVVPPLSRRQFTVGAALGGATLVIAGCATDAAGTGAGDTEGAGGSASGGKSGAAGAGGTGGTGTNGRGGAAGESGGQGGEPGSGGQPDASAG